MVVGRHRLDDARHHRTAARAIATGLRVGIIAVARGAASAAIEARARPAVAAVVGVLGGVASLGMLQVAQVLRDARAVRHLSRRAEAVLHAREQSRTLTAHEIDPLPVARVRPDDVASPSSVDVRKADARREARRVRRACETHGLRRKALACAIEPHRHFAKAHLHDVARAVAIDVFEVGAVGVEVDHRRVRHLDRAAGTFASRALEAAFTPDAEATARPVVDTAAADLRDVLQPVAVHVGEAHFRILEVEQRAREEQARLRRFRAHHPARAVVVGVAEAAVAAGDPTEVEPGLDDRACRAHDVHEVVVVHVEQADVLRVPSEVDARVEVAIGQGNGDVVPLPVLLRGADRSDRRRVSRLADRREVPVVP